MKTAAEIMNRNFFYASPGDTIGLLVHEMGERGVGSIVVLDLDGHPLGVATTPEIQNCRNFEDLTQGLHRPALCMDEHASIEAAAHTLALHPASSLVLVDGNGVAVGVLSPVELLRALLGLSGDALAHPHDRDFSWDEAELLELGAAHRAPEAPGIVLLSPGLDSSAKRIVWAEATDNVRERLDQMLRSPQEDPRLEAILEVYPRSARFRCLTMYDAGQRERLAGALCNVADSLRPVPLQSEAPGLTLPV
jgi:CBS domain-containing protein